MSHAAVSWAFRQEASHSRKLVLLFLAHSHNAKSGQCNPKIATIAEATGLAPRSVSDAIAKLEQEGLLLSVPRRNGARQGANQYLLALNGEDFQGAKFRRLKREGIMQKSAPRNCGNLHPYIEPEGRTGRRPDPDAVIDRDDEFSDAGVVAFPAERVRNHG